MPRPPATGFLNKYSCQFLNIFQYMILWIQKNKSGIYGKKVKVGLQNVFAEMQPLWLAK